MTDRWQDDAACRDIGWGLFLPLDDDDANQWNSNTYADGKAVCEVCPVRGDCLDDAMAREGDSAHQYRVGLWGGLTPNQRAVLAHQRADQGAAA